MEDQRVTTKNLIVDLNNVIIIINIRYSWSLGDHERRIILIYCCSSGQ